ncbi:MAG: ABC transporter substrate-binding protein [Actinomycetota bacterium]|nr:ABC transporter substrate-binding protein [Actinomycetota bacterium]
MSSLRRAAALLALATGLANCSVHRSASSGLPAPDRVVSRTADVDRGVTATSVTLGVVAYRQDSFAQFGLSSLGGRPVAELLKPLVDDLNTRGGIAGRRVSVAVSEFSPLVPAEAQTACVDQAGDKKVFLTLAEVSLTDDAQERCLASRQTPVVTSNSSSQTDLAADAGWVHQIAMSKDRMFKNWVDWLVSSRTATPASKIGLVHADTAEDNALVTQVFVPYLRQRGLRVAAQAGFSGVTIASVASDSQGAAQRFRDAGVDLVLPDLDFLRVFLFLQAFAALGSQARFSVSDLGQVSLGVATSFYPPSFAGTRGITAYTGDLTGGGHGTVSPALQTCLDVYQSGGRQLPPSGLERLADELQLAQFCEELALVAHVASLAGPHLNRASFVAAFDRVTGWSDRVALTGPLSFGPGKYDGADSYRQIEWRADCGAGESCYAELAPFAPGR